MCLACPREDTRRSPSTAEWSLSGPTLFHHKCRASPVRHVGGSWPGLSAALRSGFLLMISSPYHHTKAASLSRLAWPGRTSRPAAGRYYGQLSLWMVQLHLRSAGMYGPHPYFFVRWHSGDVPLFFTAFGSTPQQLVWSLWASTSQGWSIERPLHIITMSGTS